MYEENLHSNMELLLYSPNLSNSIFICPFTFQYGATTIIEVSGYVCVEITFTFQYGATTIICSLVSLSILVLFTFQYGATTIGT